MIGSLDTIMVVAATIVCATGVLTFGALAGWREWLSLKRTEIEMRRPPTASASSALTSGNIGPAIELADLRERVRKLEAIAAGVDL